MPSSMDPMGYESSLHKKHIGHGHRVPILECVVPPVTVATRIASVCLGIPS